MREELLQFAHDIAHQCAQTHYTKDANGDSISTRMITMPDSWVQSILKLNKMSVNGLRQLVSTYELYNQITLADASEWLTIERCAEIKKEVLVDLPHFENASSIKEHLHKLANTVLQSN